MSLQFRSQLCPHPCRLLACGAIVWLGVATVAGHASPQPPAAPGTTLVVRGVTLIDGNGGAPGRNVDIVVRDDRIVAIGPRQKVPGGTTEIDARGAWVVPGLIDVHVHLDAPMVFQISDEERARVLAHTPKAFLYNGVTTILNVSSPPEWIFDLRAKQREGRLLAPRIFATGRSITPDGGWGSRHGGALTDAASARAMVKSFVDMKADAIKIIIEDGLGRSGTYKEISDEMLRAAADEASRTKTPIVVHAVNLAEYRRALSIGPRAIIHGLEDPIPSGDALVADLVKAAVFVAPTLSLWEAFNGFERHPERFDDPALRGSVLPFLLSWIRKAEYRAVEKQRFLEVARMDAYSWADARMKIFMANTKAMHHAGVKLAVGTDAGGPVGYNFQGYNTIREMELLVEAGLSPMDVMVAATRTGAELIGVADRLGTLAPGKLADFLVLEADPLADIRNVRRVRTVVVGGVAHQRSEFDARTAAGKN
jgi:imidazolonepropionase-like amidohydrolase